MRLASGSPLDAPRVAPAYLQVTADRERMRAGLRMALELLSSGAMADDVEALAPPLTDDQHVDAYIDATLGSYYHYAGSARIGTDAAAVVSPALQVHGAEHMWVADASVMPRAPRGLTQAPTIAIAERAAQLIGQAAGRANALIGVSSAG